jgi:hypothetical protein
MSTRQAKSIKQIRAKRRRAGKCFDCGRKSKTYRCAGCNEKRRDNMRLVRRRWVLRHRP